MPIRYVQPSELKRDGAVMALVTLPVSWAANRALVATGVHSMPLRWVLSVIVIYTTYLGLLRIWSAGMGEVRMLGQLNESAPPRRSRSVHGTGMLELPFDLAFELEGLVLGILISAAVIGIIGLLWWIGGVAWLAGELALEWIASCGLAACLVHRTNEPWTLALVRRTWPPAAFAILAAAITGAVVQQACPAAATLREALAACVL